MARYPAMPLYTDAYLADTAHLSNHEHGIYLRLLMFAWRRADASIPDDDDRLRRVVNLTIDEWLAVKAVIMAFWTFDGKRKNWHQKRLKKERKFLIKQSAKNRDNVASRWHKTKKPPTKTIPPHPHPIVSSNEDTADVASATPERPNGRTPTRPGVSGALAAWNELAERIGLAQVKMLTEQRRKKLKALVDKYGEARFDEALHHIEASDFCRGFGSRGWKADFDWLVRPASFVRLLEGRYDNTIEHARSPPGGAASRPAAEDDYSDENMRKIGARIEAKRRAAGKISD